MIEAIRRFLNSGAGKSVGIVLALLCVGLAVFMFHNVFGRNAAERMAGDRVYICEDGKTTFTHTISPGEPAYPVKYNGMNGYPAEVCWWTADGKVATQPTYVLLNNLVGKEGPTFCPVCHRLVVGHNPVPQPGSRPPPTEDEYKQMHSTQ
jgi:hypothetical protein